PSRGAGTLTQRHGDLIEIATQRVESPSGQASVAAERNWPLLSAVRWDKTKNSVFSAATHIVRQHIPDDCLTNGICGLNYHFWRYRIPLAFDGYPILTLPHIVAGAVTVSVGATQHSRGGPHMLKPLTHFRRNLRELPPVHCNGNSRANCAERE